MQHKISARMIKIVVICVLAALLNQGLSTIMTLLEFPLYLDTVFTAAAAFAIGPIPAILVIVVPSLIWSLHWGNINFYILCSIAEALLVYALKPAVETVPEYASKDKMIASYTGIAARLFLLYIVCALAVSTLGGLIDYLTQIGIYHDPYASTFTIDDIFKPGLILHNLSPLAVCIMSRIPINLVDRFIVVFGGFFISRAIVKIVRKTEAE